jgi:lipoprotein-anchoring transpeptidase ErfK/SrfK
MNKKLFITISVIFVSSLVILFFLLNANKSQSSLQIQKGDSTSLSNLVTQAKALETKDKLLDAKNTYQRLINEFSNSSEVMNWQKKIEEINIKLLFSPTVTAGSILYEVKPGDTLDKIAKEFKTTTDLIMKSNHMTSDKLMPGRKIKVWIAHLNILVDKTQNILLLKNNEEVFKTYTVSTGLNNITPTGNFKIANKLPNPTWFKAGTVVAPGSPENILGSRWLGFDLPGYGIHGTTDPGSLGQQVTQGCVRMLNSDVEELYTIVPVGTEVIIVD